MTSNNKYLTNLFFNTFIFLITFLIFIIRVLLQLRPKKTKKNSCFRKCRWREKSSPGRPQIFFFLSIFRRYSLSFFSFFCFLLLLFFLFVCLFICCFLKSKMYILIHIRLSGRVSHKKIFTRPISGNKTIFFLVSPCCVFYCMYIPWNCWVSKCSCCFKATNNASNMCTCTCVYSLCN